MGSPEIFGKWCVLAALEMQAVLWVGDFPQGRFWAYLGRMIAPREEGGVLLSAMSREKVQIEVRGMRMTILDYPALHLTFCGECALIPDDGLVIWYNVLQDDVAATIERLVTAQPTG